VPTLLAAGDKTNAVPTRATLKCDARILPGQSLEDLERVVRALLADFPEIECSIQETAAPSVSYFSGQVRLLFEAALARTFSDAHNGPAPRARAVPTWCTGFTDSRFVRRLGTPVFGFQLIEPGADADRLSIHCVDESIEVGMLLPCAQALAHLALEFCDGARNA
jgi:carboxypeptidase PM20D1